MKLSIISQIKTRRLLVSSFMALQTAIVGTLVGEFAVAVPLMSPAKAAMAQTTSIEQAEAAVVHIETEHGSGSGVIVDADGLIVTNAHVVEGASQVSVTIRGRAVPAEVVALGSSNCLDLALLRVSNQGNLPVTPFGNLDKVQKTQQVFAIGFPGAVPSTSATITRGIVSNLHHRQGLVQFDGAIIPGNSGGAVVNSDGELIGIATGQAVDSNGSPLGSVSLAVSVDQVMVFIESYRQGYSPAIGRMIKPGSAPDSGGLEQALALDGRAIHGALQPGDSSLCSDGSLADVFTFDAEMGQSVMLEMLSQDMGVYIMLVSPSGEMVARTGREEPNQVAIVLEKLPETGTYTVVANALQPERSGRYQLRATQPFLVERGSLERHTRPCFEGGQRCQDYHFQGQANQTVTVLLQQAEFDPYLALLDASGNVITRGQTDRDAMLSFTLHEDGWYTLLVSSVEIDANGQFMVSVHDTETLTSTQDVSQR